MTAVLSGMTGFGRAEGALGDWAWTIEARSVNGRSLEVRIKAPPGFDGLDRQVREGAQARFQRGQVGVTVQARRAERGGEVRINQPMLTAYRTVIDELVAAGASAPSADGLLNLRGVIENGEAIEDDLAEVQNAMGRDLAVALDGLKTARRGRAPARLPHPGIHARGQYALFESGDARLDLGGAGPQSRDRTAQGAGAEC